MSNKIEYLNRLLAVRLFSCYNPSSSQPNPIPRVLSYSSPGGAEVGDEEDPCKRGWFSSQSARLQTTTFSQSTYL